MFSFKHVIRSSWSKRVTPVNIYLFKFNNINIRKRPEICPKLAIKTAERRDALSEIC